MPQPGLLPSYGRVAVKVKAKPPDSMHLGDLSTKHVATNAQGMRIPVIADVPYASARSKERVPVSCGSRQSRKTRLFGRTLRDLCSIFKSLAWASEATRIGIHDAKSQ